jgi:hypothetical protein
MSIWARNPENGHAKRVYQMTPHDEWDDDGVNEMVLFEKGGQKLLAHSDRNGIGYTVDRTNGKVIVANAFGPIKQYLAVLSGVGGWAGIGVAAGIGAEDPTAGLGALGAFGDVGQFPTPQGGVKARLPTLHQLRSCPNRPAMITVIPVAPPAMEFAANRLRLMTPTVPLASGALSPDGSCSAGPAAAARSESGSPSALGVPPSR